MLSHNQRNALPVLIVKRLRELNTRYLETIGNRINEIGAMSATDAHRLQQLKAYGSDVDMITRELMRVTAKNAAEIYEIYDIVAKDNIEFSKRFYDATGNSAKYIPYEENPAMQAWVRALARQTAETYINMSQTTGFMMYNDRGEKVFTSLSRTYQNVIDRAVTAVTTGVSDYQSEMRGTFKELADSGMRTKYTPLRGSAGKTVDYASGYSRRLDTAVRQNILWGVKECNLGIQEQIGEELGADGYEIDYHRNPRPTHAPMGGEQFAIGPAREVKGKYYESFEIMAEPFLEEYGCLHFKWPIICGVSEPNWDPDELARLKARDKETFEYEGKRYTGYEATQVQRKLETAIRHAKDRQIIAAATGDDTLRRQEQAKINALKNQYEKFSDAAGLRAKNERMSVSGYHKVKASNEMPVNTDGANSGLTNDSYYDKVRNRMQPLTLNLGSQGKHMLGHNNYIDGRSYMMATEAEIQELVNEYSGTGKFMEQKNGIYSNRELVSASGYSGVNIDPRTGELEFTSRFYIHYSQKGTHVVPTLRKD